MIIYCLKTDSIIGAAEYSINYILNRCGFFFEWITSPKEIKGEGLLLIYQSAKIPNTYPLPAIHLHQEFKLNELLKNKIKWNVITIANDDIPILISPENPDLANSKIHISSFDIIANVYYHLARLEENNYQHPDDTDKNVKISILFKNGKFMIPVVDILCDFFKDEIEYKFKENNMISIRKSYYPENQSFGIALTHDVDFIRAFHPIKKIFLKLFILLGLKKNITAREIDQIDNLTWGFDKLISFYKQNNLKATFFFLTRYIEGWHFRYRIASNRMKRLLAQLKSDKHEISFHPSRYAFENPKRYSKEKIKLEKISGLTISGIRHHYLRCLYPQIWQTAAQLNLKYDTGMIHRRYSGFRAGTCYPFETFNHRNQKQYDIIEFPITFFENALPEKGTDLEASKDTIKQLLEIVKKQGGLFNILWHSNNIYQPEVYAKLWESTLSLIKDEDALNQPLIEHYKWHKIREKINLTSYENTSEGFSLNIAVPAGIDKFTLHVPANYKFKSNSKMQHDPIKNILIIDCDDSNAPIFVEAQTI